MKRSDIVFYSGLTALALMVVLFITLVLSATGCQSMRQGLSHAKSSIVGISRRVTLYSDGREVKRWTGKMNVDVDGATARFIHRDRVVIISGTFLVEEVDD